MYLNCKVKIPDTEGKVTVITINGTPYVYYEYGRTYLKDKKYNTPKRTCIGKRDPEQHGFLYPNEKFLKYFLREMLPIEKATQFRSVCIHIGAYLVIRKIISDYRLDEMIARIIGRDAGLFLDFAAYSIITEDNAGQNYADYAYNHSLFTDDMRIYSDSKVSDFLNGITVDQRISFLIDYFTKLFKYRTSGVREYWIVDPERNLVTIYEFQNDSAENYAFADDIPAGIYPGFSDNLSVLDI